LFRKSFCKTSRSAAEQLDLQRFVGTETFRWQCQMKAGKVSEIAGSAAARPCEFPGDSRRQHAGLPYRKRRPDRSGRRIFVDQR